MKMNPSYGSILLLQRLYKISKKSGKIIEGIVLRMHHVLYVKKEGKLYGNKLLFKKKLQRYNKILLKT